MDALSDEELIVSADDGVARITLNRPDRLNALSAQMMDSLKALFRSLARDDSVRAVLLTGIGRGFCAGADLSDTTFLNDEHKGDVAGDMLHARLNLMIRAIKEHPKPVVAAVNGLAVGGGMSIALAADIVIAARSASFSQLFAPNVGIVPDAGSTWLLPRAVGSARAAGMMMLGEKLSAQQALDWGMVWGCVDDEALMPEAERIARKLADGPTTAFRLLKEALRVSGANSFAGQLDIEAEVNRVAFATEDAGEAIRAFNEKRRPTFKGK